MHVLDFILSLNLKYLLNIISHLNEKMNLLIWNLFYQVNTFKIKLNVFLKILS